MADRPEIPGYEILGVAGEGATATVYEARERLLGRRVALKVFRDEDQGREEFEALSLCVGIESPHVTRVHRAGVQGGVAFVEMELLPGRTLLGKVRAEGRLKPGEAVEVLLGVLDGLRALHRAGLVHRDVKPANIFLAGDGGDGIVKLGDFGLVRSEEGPATYARGTPGYVPPETTTLAHPRPPSTAQDVYAAGAVLFFCLTGRDPDRFWRLRLRQVPHTLRPVLFRALEEDPVRRFAGVGEMRDALLKSSRRGGRRFRRAAAGAAVALVLACVSLLLLPDRRRVALTIGEHQSRITGVEISPDAPNGEPHLASPHSALRIEGTADTGAPLSHIEYMNSNWQDHVLKAEGVSPWEIYLSLESGENAITITAEDVEGRRLSRTIHVVCGGVFACGDNVWGQLAAEGRTDASTPDWVGDLGLVTAIAAGRHHALALTAEGEVWGWGRNTHGQIGDGTWNDRPRPVRVEGLGAVLQIAAGGEHSLALLRDGTVRAWGRGREGQIGDGGTMDRPFPTPVRGLSGVAAIAAGGRHSAGVLKGGDVVCWGDNSDGQIGDGTAQDRLLPTSVSDPASPAGKLSGVVDLSAGDRHTLAILHDGTLRAWGANEVGQVGSGAREAVIRFATAVADPEEPGEVLRGVAGMTAGARHSLALLKDGQVLAWGANDHGQLGNGERRERRVPVYVKDIAHPSGFLSGVTGLAAGPAAEHCAALSGDRGMGVRTWGANGRGQLGDGTREDRAQPVRVRDFASPLDILNYVTGAAVGGRFTVVLK